MEIVFEEEQNNIIYSNKLECYENQPDKDVYVSIDIVKGKGYSNVVG